MRLLLVEDDRKLGPLLAKVLAANGYDVELAATAAAARAAASGGHDLAVIDWMLPDGDGLGVCADLHRADFQGPIVMLTARAETRDRVQALDFGVDDFVPKPFETDELLARLRAVLRRGTRATSLDVGPLHVDLTKRYAFVGGALLPLTARELDLLVCLARARGAPVSRATLVQQVWDADALEPNVLEVHVSRLRDKLGESAKLVETVRGVGYRLAPEALA